MIVKKIEWTDVFAANCYFYIDETSKHGFIIDPSGKADELLNIIRQNGWTIEKMLLTHSHLDHIGAAPKLLQALNIEIFGLKSSKEYLSNKDLAAHFTDKEVIKNLVPLKDGDSISLTANPNIQLKIIATAGHTIDSAVYYDKQNNIAFTGDTIFANGIGRTDIEGSGGNYAALMTSIKEKIFTLPDNTVLYPGHGAQTSVKNEKSNF